MSERLRQRIDERFVKVSVLAAGFERDLLAAVVGNVAHQAREAAEELFDRHHADLHGRALQSAEYLRLERESVCELGAQWVSRVQSRKFGDGLLQNGFCDHHLAHKVKDGV